jgi:antirestriction protein ArdC
MSTSVYEAVTRGILDLLERGIVPWHRPWTTCASPPANMVSRRPYRGINSLTTRCVGYASPWWISFRQIHVLGGCVRKGEHGIPILFFKPTEGMSQEPRDHTITADDHVELRRGQAPLIRYTHVFNLLQTEGIDQRFVPDPPAAAIAPDDRAETILSAWEQAPQVQIGFDRADYSPPLDVVRMPPRDRFETPAAYYATLWHECAHATGHPTRLGRFSVDARLAPFGSCDYSKEELIAEMTAAFICGELGFHAEIESSAAYVDHWLHVLRADRRLLIQVAADAQRAADCIHGLTNAPQRVSC